MYGVNLGVISHDTKIDWLELNETGHKLLFRDKRQRLQLVDIETKTNTVILNYCTFVQASPPTWLHAGGKTYSLVYSLQLHGRTPVIDHVFHYVIYDRNLISHVSHSGTFLQRRFSFVPRLQQRYQQRSKIASVTVCSNRDLVRFCALCVRRNVVTKRHFFCFDVL